MAISRKPRKTKKDHLYTATKALISGAPIVGGSAAEFFSAIFIPPIEKRKEEWMESIANDLYELQKSVKTLRPEALAKNETFITTVMHASQIAIRNHQQEKIEALRNAVLNSAFPNAPEEDLQTVYLAMIDVFTPWHLRILKLCDESEGINIDYKPSITIQSFEPLNPKKLRRESHHVHQQSKHLEDAFPLLKNKSQFYMQILFELSQRGLIERTGNAEDTHPSDDWFKITDFGKQFIRFISHRR